MFVNTADPVGLGLVTSLTRPGGNTTGIANYIVELSQKRLELVIEAKPDVSRIAILFNPANAVSVAALRQTDAAAQALGRKIIAVPAQTPDELASALQLLGREQPGALLAGGADVMIGSRSASVAQFALERRLATMFTMPRDARAGGLMAYGTDPTESYRRAAALVDRILKGAKPADLPVEQPTKFELVINLRTAKAIGFSVPPALLSRADEVIE